VAFGDITSLPLSSVIGGTLSTILVTSTPSGRPPALEPNTPVVHAPTLGACCQGGAMLSRFGNLRPMSGSAGPGIDHNRTPSTRCATPAGTKKPCHISTADMPPAVNLFNDMPEPAQAPTNEVMGHPTCQLSLPVG
jgi:hypothetical protein